MWATAILICVASAGGQVTIETVTVGSIGNIPELTGEDAIIGGNALGNGSNRLAGTVNYVYEMGKYEVTAKGTDLFVTRMRPQLRSDGYLPCNK